MAMIETEHNGIAIHYSENKDVWRCEPLYLEAKTLSALRTKINEWSARQRRVSNLPVLRLSKYSWDGIREAEATLIDPDGESVWIIVEKMRGGRSAKAGREKVKLSDLAPETPQVRAAIHRYSEAVEASRVAKNREEELFAAIPRITLDDLRSVDQASEAAE